MRNKINRLAPPGLPWRQEVGFFVTGAICALVYSLLYFIRLGNNRRHLFENPEEEILWPGAIMPDFADILENALVGFLIIAVCMIGFVIYHYLYFRQGSKSIYLMKRLPKRWELHRRCWTLPVMGAVLCGIIAFLLLVIYFRVYMAVTPEECLTDGQWMKIWRGLL